MPELYSIKYCEVVGKAGHRDKLETVSLIPQTLLFKTKVHFCSVKNLILLLWGIFYSFPELCRATFWVLAEGMLEWAQCTDKGPRVWNSSHHHAHSFRGSCCFLAQS